MTPFLQYAQKSDLREKLFRGYFMKGDDPNEYDNIVCNFTRSADSEPMAQHMKFRGAEQKIEPLLRKRGLL